MYCLKIKCGIIEFLNDTHFIKWSEKNYNCKDGCINKICEEIYEEKKSKEIGKLTIYNVK